MREIDDRTPPARDTVEKKRAMSRSRLGVRVEDTPLILDSGSFSLRFLGDSAAVDLRTFTESLLGLSTVVEGINAAVNPEVQFDLRVSAPTRGSLIANLVLHPA